MKNKKTTSQTQPEQNEYGTRRRIALNKAIGTYYTRRNHLENELKEVNSVLIRLTKQLQIDEEYKSFSFLK
tara:strand:- start:554 stop:766 length:213 start_codon:yes stop_codon:yes gene_type:complete